MQNVINGVRLLINMEKKLANGGSIDEMVKQAKPYSEYNANICENEVVLNKRNIDPIQAFPDLTHHNNLMAKVC